MAKSVHTTEVVVCKLSKGFSYGEVVSRKLQYQEVTFHEYYQAWTIIEVGGPLYNISPELSYQYCVPQVKEVDVD